MTELEGQLQRKVEELEEQARLSKETLEAATRAERELENNLKDREDKLQRAADEAEFRIQELQTQIETKHQEAERQRELLAGVLYFKNQNPGEGFDSVEEVAEHVQPVVEATPPAPEGDMAGLGRELSLSMTFGEDTSPSSLERFLTHWELVDQINRARQVRTWKKDDYRACILRMALRGSAADWISQESTMLSPWVKSDNEIIAKLKVRYIGNTAIELHIIAFEQSSQKDGETLGEYMVRLQKLIENAYGKHPPYIKQMRVVWQFLNGLRDRDVREVLIKEKWMEDGENAKSYDEILKIAEGTLSTKIASRATGKSGQGAAAAVQEIGTVAPFKGGSARKETPNSNSRDRQQSTKQKIDCYYCGSTHEGYGWYKCSKRRAENPKWRPGDTPSKDFQKPPVKS